MAMVPHRFPGLAQTVYLPDDLIVESVPIPDSMIGWVRSSSANAPEYSTWHDTGNDGSTARDEAAYLRSGPRDQYGNKYQVGYNGAVDDERLVLLTPFNEDTWAQGTWEGNHTSWAIEQCFGDGIDWERSKRNAAAVHGGLIASQPGWELRPSLVQHFRWNGKDCPGQLRRRGEWESAVSLAEEFFNAARAAAKGEPAPAPVVGRAQPETPELAYPAGMDRGIAARLFGRVKGDDRRDYFFDPVGPVSQLWLQTGKARGAFPPLAEVWTYGDGRKYFVFRDGLTIFHAPNQPVRLLG